MNDETLRNMKYYLKNREWVNLRGPEKPTKYDPSIEFCEYDRTTGHCSGNGFSLCLESGMFTNGDRELYTDLRDGGIYDRSEFLDISPNQYKFLFSDEWDDIDDSIEKICDRIDTLRYNFVKEEKELYTHVNFTRLMKMKSYLETVKSEDFINKKTAGTMRSNWAWGRAFGLCLDKGILANGDKNLYSFLRNERDIKRASFLGLSHIQYRFLFTCLDSGYISDTIKKISMTCHRIDMVTRGYIK